MRLLQTIAAVALTAGAATGAAGAPPGAAAKVEANRVSHPGERITVSVPASAVYAGGERFTLYDVADAEAHVFVEADASKRVRKLYWIQFESYLPSPMNHSYNYAEGNERQIVWGAPTWVRAGPASTASPPRSGSDQERVVSIVKGAGYTIPAEVMNVRMVQLLDDPQGTGKGTRELMIIYGEDLAPTRKTLAELTTDGKPNAAWKALEQPLIERAAKAVTVERR